MKEKPSKGDESVRWQAKFGHMSGVLTLHFRQPFLFLFPFSFFFFALLIIIIIINKSEISFLISYKNLISKILY